MKNYTVTIQGFLFRKSITVKADNPESAKVIASEQELCPSHCIVGVDLMPNRENVASLGHSRH